MKVNLNLAPELPFPNAKNRGRVVMTTYPGEMEVNLDSEGNLLLDNLKVTIVQTESQRGRLPNGFTVKSELKNAEHALLSATLLDFLLSHQNYIPKHWEEKDVCIFFWGTQFSDSRGSECVRLMTFNGSRWNGDQYWPNCIWHTNYKAAVVEKPKQDLSQDPAVQIVMKYADHAKGIRGFSFQRNDDDHLDFRPNA